MPRVGQWIRFANGNVVHVLLTVPGCRFCRRCAEFECDWPNPKRKSGTCDRKLCRFCAVHIAGGKQHCPDHQEESEHDQQSPSHRRGYTPLLFR